MTRAEKPYIVVGKLISASPRRNGKITLPPKLKRREVIFGILFGLGWIALIVFSFAGFLVSMKIFWTGGL